MTGLKTTVLGLGLIGGSLGLALKRSGFASRVAGVDRSSEHGKTAVELGLVDEVQPLEAALKNAELVILAIPVDAIEELLPRILDLVPSTATVTDMGSTKALICRAVSRHPKRLQFVASHPMAGTENSGPTAALADLFQGKTAVICDCETSGAEHLERIQRMYAALGMRTIYLGSEAHDRHAAFVSHLSHISSFALATTVLEKEKDELRIFDLAGGGFESTVRLGKSSPEMWAPVFKQNLDNVTQALGDYITQLQDFHRKLVGRDWPGVTGAMRNANDIRRILDKKAPKKTEKP